MKPCYRQPALLILLLLLINPADDVFGQKKGGPPPWAPAHGYRAKTRHIYFPEYNFYYDIQRSVYIYLSGDRWEMNVRLPSRYSGIDLKVAHGIELEISSDSPQRYNTVHSTRYRSSVSTTAGKNGHYKTKDKYDKGKGKKKYK